MEHAAKTGLFIAGVGAALVAAQTALLIGYSNIDKDFENGTWVDSDTWIKNATNSIGVDACLGLPLLCAWDAAKAKHI